MEITIQDAWRKNPIVHVVQTDESEVIEARGRNIPQVNCKDLKFSQAQIDRVANGSEGTDYLSLLCL